MCDRRNTIYSRDRSGHESPQRPPLCWTTFNKYPTISSTALNHSGRCDWDCKLAYSKYYVGCHEGVDSSYVSLSSKPALGSRLIRCLPKYRLHLTTRPTLMICQSCSWALELQALATRNLVFYIPIQSAYSRLF